MPPEQSALPDRLGPALEVDDAQRMLIVRLRQLAASTGAAVPAGRRGWHFATPIGPDADAGPLVHPGTVAGRGAQAGPSGWAGSRRPAHTHRRIDDVAKIPRSSPRIGDPRLEVGW
jgi:hypothetical protein